jgi:hypothetical protein
MVCRQVSTRMSSHVLDADCTHYSLASCLSIPKPSSPQYLVKMSLSAQTATDGRIATAQQPVINKPKAHRYSKLA